MQQGLLEEVLEHALEQRGSSVARLEEVTKVCQRDGFVRVTTARTERSLRPVNARHGAGGETVWDAAFVIGADGHDSFCRRALGIEMVEQRPMRLFGIYDFAAELSGTSERSEIAARRSAGYRPVHHIAQSPALSEALELIGSGFFSMGDRDRYRPIIDLLRGPDPYMVCADFDSYVECEARAAAAYREPEEWSRRALLNVAGARRFSIDNTVREYASQIWNIRPVLPEASVE